MKVIRAQWADPKPLPFRDILKESGEDVVVMTSREMMDLLGRAIGFGQDKGPPELNEGRFNALRQETFRFVAWLAAPGED